jgi:hypothetical protein
MLLGRLPEAVKQETCAPPAPPAALPVAEPLSLTPGGGGMGGGQNHTTGSGRSSLSTASSPTDATAAPTTIALHLSERPSELHPPPARGVAAPDHLARHLPAQLAPNSGDMLNHLLHAVWGQGDASLASYSTAAAAPVVNSVSGRPAPAPQPVCLEDAGLLQQLLLAPPQQRQHILAALGADPGTSARSASHSEGSGGGGGGDGASDPARAGRSNNATPNEGADAKDSMPIYGSNSSTHGCDAVAFMHTPTASSGLGEAANKDTATNIIMQPQRADAIGSAAAPATGRTLEGEGGGGGGGGNGPPAALDVPAILHRLVLQSLATGGGAAPASASALLSLGALPARGDVASRVPSLAAPLSAAAAAAATHAAGPLTCPDAASASNSELGLSLNLLMAASGGGAPASALTLPTIATRVPRGGGLKAGAGAFNGTDSCNNGLEEQQKAAAAYAAMMAALGAAPAAGGEAVPQQQGHYLHHQQQQQQQYAHALLLAQAGAGAGPLSSPAGPAAAALAAAWNRPGAADRAPGGVQSPAAALAAAGGFDSSLAMAARRVTIPSTAFGAGSGVPTGGSPDDGGWGAEDGAPAGGSASATAAAAAAAARRTLPPPGAPQTSLYIKGLPRDEAELFLYRSFCPYGAVLSCHVYRDATTGRSKCVFVRLVCREHAACLCV